ncbi:MAG: hypothetical protein H6825_00295 [Planctomycetes bacterium]|nr:hypothetical protein [Planctomycetota bacterium]
MDAASFSKQMLELGHFSYLTCVAGSRVIDGTPEQTASDVPLATSAFGVEPDGGNKITMTLGQVQYRLPAFRTWLMQSLLVRLDTLLHAALDGAIGRSAEQDSGQVEADVHVLAPNVKVDHPWAYKDVVLLAVHRNCIVHGDGSLPPSREQRLLDAGWVSRQEALERVNWRHPTFADFIQYKKAVRTVGNACLQAASV